MPGMRMTPATWHGAAGFLGLWLAMMLPMMLPSLVPMLLRYRHSVPGARGLARHGLTAVVAVGYFVVWAALGSAVHTAGAVLSVLEMRWGGLHRLQPALAGIGLLLAGAVQFTSWKARQLGRCREASAGTPGATALGAWRHGLRLGTRCGLSCGNLMLALLAIGMMDPVAMAATTVGISAERLSSAPRLASRAAGLAIAAGGLLTLASS
jgi:predicted metal-binding membrane protein